MSLRISSVNASHACSVASVSWLARMGQSFGVWGGSPWCEVGGGDATRRVSRAASWGGESTGVLDSASRGGVGMAAMAGGGWAEGDWEGWEVAEVRWEDGGDVAMVAWWGGVVAAVVGSAMSGGGRVSGAIGVSLGRGGRW